MRRAAIVGTAPKSSREAISVFRAWSGYMIALRRSVILPPTPDDLAVWSVLFKTRKVYTNDVGKLKMVCELMRVSTDSFVAPELRRARVALSKRESPEREKQFIDQDLVRRLVSIAIDDCDFRSAAMYIAAYAFLLRVPS